MRCGKWVSLNVGGFVDTRTVGEQPNRFDEEVLGGEASLVVAIEGLRIEAQGLLQRTEFPTTGVDPITALGLHAQWSYRLWGFEAGYRFALFDPNNRFDADKIMEHTIGLSYYVSKLPLKFSLNGTFAQEDRALDNNRLVALGQFDF